MRQIRQFLRMATLAVMGAIMAGCATEDNVIVDAQQPADQTRTITLTTTVTLDGGSATRALVFDKDNHKVVKSFAAGDKIAVKYRQKGWPSYYETAISNELTTDDISDEGKTATFTVTLDDPDPDNTEVRYVYPVAMENDWYRNTLLESEQDGTLATLASKFDYCEGSGTISYSGTTPVLPSITLKNQLTLAKFTVSDGTSDITKNLTQLMIDDGSHCYFVSRTAADEPIWVAMYPIASTQTVKVTASDGVNSYERSVSEKKLDASMLYSIAVTTSPIVNERMTPLTLEAKENNATVSFKLTSAVTQPVEYCTYASASDTWSAWAEYTSEQTINLAAEGDKVCFRGSNSTYDESNISCTGDCYLYGNVMSLISAKTFPIVTSLTGSHAFVELFKGNSHIYNHDTRSFLLPATTLGDNCYQRMFKECENLTTAPDLPATRLTIACYLEMFQGCSNLEHAPVLPATDLSDHCYERMFQDCQKLKSVTCLATKNCSDIYYTGGMLAGAGRDGIDTDITPYNLPYPEFDLSKYPVFYKAAGTNWPTTDPEGNATIPSYWIVQDYVAP